MISFGRFLYAFKTSKKRDKLLLDLTRTMGFTSTHIRGTEMSGCAITLFKQIYASSRRMQVFGFSLFVLVFVVIVFHVKILITVIPRLYTHGHIVFLIGADWNIII